MTVLGGHEPMNKLTIFDTLLIGAFLELCIWKARFVLFIGWSAPIGESRQVNSKYPSSLQQAPLNYVEKNEAVSL